MSKIWLAVLVVAVYSQAEADVLCKRTNGSVFLRAACKKKEVQIDPVALGLQGPAGPKGDKGNTGPQGPAGPGAVVRDAHEAFVGAYDNQSVLIDVGNMLVSVSLEGNSSAASFRDDYLKSYTENVDCSGTRFVDITTSSFFSSGIISGTTLYVLPTSGGTLMTLNAEVATHSSLITGSGSCPGTQFFIPPHSCCQPFTSSFTRTVTPLVEVGTFDLSGFVPPFHVAVQE